MNPSLSAAVVQLAPTVDAAANRSLITGLVAEAAAAGARLAVLPEEAMLTAGEVKDEPVADVVSREWPLFVTLLSDLAIEHDIWLIAGGYEPSGQARPYNTLVVLNPRGEVVTTYRKVHLYDAFSYRESDYVVPGAELPPVVMVEGVAIGLINCYDIRFPELARDLVDRGADVLSVSAAWVSGPAKEDHWTTLVRARAIENTCWVLASGTSSADCIGHSLAVDPLGTVRAGLGPVKTGVGLVQISLDRTAEVRESLPSLANRRLSVTVEIPA
ncbi:carbon-nitrogen hydrolase family protein [Kineosporia sp. J2-2]|uniref:Carbon-nitrogen hydrolase family protein n=1 Tax=Kineosporia corallincola TaxID=2835133 RepID=A0ABS5TAH0_9ACTN|nr:carbon-nitrogen hydrolase family protein [Kineosporia corallincola]MBT0768036.1 carbon-nitrogen hydrolase family protein [Kineosporia corallincola]